MNPKRRLACSERKRSARNPQKTDTTRRLKTLAYTKKNRPAARRAGPSRNVRSPKNATKLAGERVHHRRHEHAPGRARDEGSEQRVDDERAGERPEEEPVQGEAASRRRAHLVAERPDDVVAAEDEEERERGPDEARALSGLDPHEAGKRAPPLHAVSRPSGPSCACASCQAARTAGFALVAEAALQLGRPLLRERSSTSRACPSRSSLRGRNVRPFATARALLTRPPPASSPVGRGPDGQVAPLLDLLRLRGTPRPPR